MTKKTFNNSYSELYLITKEVYHKVMDNITNRSDKDETIELAFKNGRDMYLITNKRVLSIDVQGLTGKKIEFLSTPFKGIGGFSVKSAGTLSRTVKTTLFISKMEGGITTDLGKKGADIFQINNSLGNKILNHTIHQV